MASVSAEFGDIFSGSSSVWYLVFLSLFIFICNHGMSFHSVPFPPCFSLKYLFEVARDILYGISIYMHTHTYT